MRRLRLQARRLFRIEAAFSITYLSKTNRIRRTIFNLLTRTFFSLVVDMGHIVLLDLQLDVGLLDPNPRSLSRIDAIL